MSARRSLSFAAMLFLPVGLFTVRSYGQAIGSIRGTVVDTTAAVIEGASLSITNTSTGLAHSAVTNQSGIFVFSDVAIGS